MRKPRTSEIKVLNIMKCLNYIESKHEGYKSDFWDIIAMVINGQSGYNHKMPIQDSYWSPQIPRRGDRKYIDEEVWNLWVIFKNYFPEVKNGNVIFWASW